MAKGMIGLNHWLWLKTLLLGPLSFLPMAQAAESDAVPLVIGNRAIQESSSARCHAARSETRRS